MSTKAKAKAERPIPVPTTTTQGFWDATKRKKLALQYDPVARRYQWWPRIISVRTGKQNLQWKDVSGTGTLYSYTITYVPMPGFEDQVPYPVGVVELKEGVRIISSLRNVKNEDLKIGMKLKVCWEKATDDLNHFAFEPA